MRYYEITINENQMKRIFFLLMAACFAGSICEAQSVEVSSKEVKSKEDSRFEKLDSAICRIDSILDDIDFELYYQNKMKQEESDAKRFKMYQTENIHILLKLDTQRGIIEVVQWELDEDKEFSIYLNSENLGDFDSAPGQFELYPTKNMYQFILLDTKYGATWHVQWGTRSGENWIRPIY